MSSSPRANVLAERDPNVPQSPEKGKNGLKVEGKDAPKSLEYHRQALEARLKESQSVNTTTAPTTSEKTRSQPSVTDENIADMASFGDSSASSITTTATLHHAPVVRQAHNLRSASRNQETYVSPSDNIMSPATAKLAAFKNRHVKSVKPRTLFAKTTASNAEAAAAKQSTTSTPFGQEMGSES